VSVANKPRQSFTERALFLFWIFADLKERMKWQKSMTFFRSST
jgi:hypothetical protein